MYASLLRIQARSDADLTRSGSRCIANTLCATDVAAMSVAREQALHVDGIHRSFLMAHPNPASPMIKRPSLIQQLPISSYDTFKLDG